MNKKIIIITILVLVALSVFCFFSFKKTISTAYIGANGQNTADGYRSDQLGVYFRGDLIKGLDQKTAKYVGNCCVKDEKTVNCCGSFVSNTDAGSFTFIGKYFSRDDKNIYYGSSNSIEIIPNADVSSFEIVGGAYSKDQKNVYYDTKLVVGADSKTIIYVNPDPIFAGGDGYAKDKNGIYFYGLKIENVDPTSFSYLGNQYSKDKNRVFFSGGFGDGTTEVLSPVQGADTKTFEVINSQFAKDKNSVYVLGKATNADPKNCTSKNVKGCEPVAK